MTQKSNIPKRRADEEQPVLELNSHQLIYAVVGLIASFCILFSLGILTGKMSEQGGTGQGAVLGRQGQAPGEGRQTTPRTGVLTAGAGDDTIKEFAAPTRPLDERRGVRDHDGPKETPQPAEPVKPLVTEPELPWETRQPPGPEREGDAAGVGATKEAKGEPLLAAAGQEDAEPAPANPAGIEEGVAPSEDTVPPASVHSERDIEDAIAESVPPPPPPVNRKGRFAVQVASFEAKNRERAEAFVRELASVDKLDAIVAPSEDGKWCRVFVGQYADKASAAEAWNDLKERPKFKGCFIKVLD